MRHCSMIEKTKSVSEQKGTGLRNIFPSVLMKWGMIVMLCIPGVNLLAQTANTGTEFYAAFGRNNQIMDVKQVIYEQKLVDNIQLSFRITAANSADVRFYFTENSSLDTTLRVFPGITDYILTRPQAQASYTSYHPANNDPPNRKSIRITSTEPISLIAVSGSHTSVEAALILPKENLGKEYLHVGNERYQTTAPEHSNGYVIVATENNTLVTQYTKQLQVGDTITRIMDKGDVFFYGFNVAPGWNPMGARIVADKPIAFFQNGTRTQLGTNATKRNYTFEQIPPVEQFGTKFILPTNDLDAGCVRIYPKDTGDVNIDVIFSNNTVKTYKLNKNHQVSYNRYRDIVINIDSVPNQVNSCYITSDKPVSACAYNIPKINNPLPGQDQTAQPGVAWLPPIEQTTKSVLVSPINFDATYMFLQTRHYFLIVVPTASKANTTISINGAPSQPISSISNTTFNWIQDNIGGSGYSFGRYYFGTSEPPINQYLNTTALVENPDGLILLAYGQGSYANYFYSIGHSGRPIAIDPDWVRLRRAIETHGAETVTVYPITEPFYTEDLSAPHAKLVLTQHADSIFSDGTPIRVNHDVAIVFNDTVLNNTLVLYTENFSDGRHFEMTGNTTKTFSFNKTALDGGNVAGGINVISGTNTITGVVIQNCVSVSTGGGINASSPISLDSVTIKNCKAGYDNGVWSINGSGGGIYTTDTLTIDYSTIDSCQAGGYGGGIQCVDADISYSTIQNNQAAIQSIINAQVGGGIHSTGILTISHSAVKNNSCNSNAGGISAINLTLAGNVEVSGNISNYFGGGIKTKNIDVSNITQLLVKNNKATEDGGGIYVNNDLIFPDSAVVEISGNISVDGDGGGIHVEDGVLHIAGNFTVANNKAGNNGGGLSVYDPTTLTTHGNNIVFSDNEAIRPYWIKHNDLYRGISGADIINTHAPAHPPLKHNTFSDPPTVNAPFEYAYNNFDVNWVPKNGDTTNYLLIGTVFPFVYHTDLNGNPDTAFNNLFTTTAKLYAVPDVNRTDNPIEEILQANPLFETNVKYYNGSLWCEGIPKNPGEIAAPNNPGVSIHWEELVHQSLLPPVNDMTLADGELPQSPIGVYAFRNIPEGDYILALFRQGYVTRFAEVSMLAKGGFIGHRELIPGDMKGNLQVDNADVSEIKQKFTTFNSPNYKPIYDVNADGQVNETDLLIVNKLLGFSLFHYSDTRIWILKY